MGTGLGMYKYTSQQYPVEVDGVLSRYGTRAQTAHNEYLHIAVELGVFGLLVLCWGIAKVAHGVLASDREANERSIAIGLTGGVLGMLTQAAVDSSFHQPPIVLLLLLFGALLLNMQLQRGSRHWMLEFAVRPTKLTVCGIYILAALVSIVAIRPAFAWYAWVDAQRLLLAKDIEGSHARLDWAVFLAQGNATYHDAHAEAAFQQLRVSGGDRALARIDYAAPSTRSMGDIGVTVAASIERWRMSRLRNNGSAGHLKTLASPIVRRLPGTRILRAIMSNTRVPSSPLAIVRRHTPVCCERWRSNRITCWRGMDWDDCMRSWATVKGSCNNIGRFSIGKLATGICP